MDEKKKLNENELDQAAGGIAGNVGIQAGGDVQVVDMSSFNTGTQVGGDLISGTQTQTQVGGDLVTGTQVGGDYVTGTQAGGDVTGGNKTDVDASIDVALEINKSLF